MRVDEKRTQSIRRVLWIILFLNLFVAAAKIVTGGLISSMAVSADGFHSLADGTSNIVGLVGIAFSSRPVDSDHPYGHGKMETLASLFITGMLAFLGIRVISDAVIKLFSPQTPNISWISLVVMGATLCINILVFIYEDRKGRALQSSILITDAAHTKSDIYISAGVLLSLLLIRFGLPPVVDSIVSMAVAGFILKAAYEIFRFTRDILVDKAMLDDERILAVLGTFEEVLGAHKIRSRGTALDCHVDMHIFVNPSMTVKSSHELVHSIGRAMMKEFGMNIQVIVHVEPYTED